MELSLDIVIPFNVLMAVPMRANFGKVIKESLQELKYFVENGEIHPRTAKVNKTKKAKKAVAKVTGE